MGKYIKKYVAYNPTTFEFMGFYSEGRKDLPETVDEVDRLTFLTDKGEHTHYSPLLGFHTVEVQLTTEEIRAKFKADRHVIIANMKVTVDGMEFDADKVARDNLVGAVTALDPLETQMWVLANNEVVLVTREQLQRVLRGIKENLDAIWVQT